LGPLFKPPKRPGTSLPTEELVAEPSVNAAYKQVLRGRERKAFRLLSSNGVAASSGKTIAALRKLHPALPVELKLPTTNCPQLVIDPVFVRDKLFKDAADNNISNDVYGWSASMFFHVRAQKGGFTDALTDFICLLGNHPQLIHHTTALLLTSGLLTPLNKVGRAEQKLARELDLEPKVRPINSGTLFTKVLFAAVLSTPQAGAAALTTQPHQLALGTSRGVERLVHICRAAYHSNYLIRKNDYQNGFNSLSRQALLDAHCEAFPAATGIFNRLYGIKAPCYTFDDHGQLVAILSEQGSRACCRH
jgi:hypothetical protein